MRGFITVDRQTGVPVTAIGGRPDHDTMAHFRRRFGAQFEQLFVQVLMLAREMGTLKLGKVSVDGSKIKANASKHRALSWGHLQKIKNRQRLYRLKTLVPGAGSGPEFGDRYDLAA